MAIREAGLAERIQGIGKQNRTQQRIVDDLRKATKNRTGEGSLEGNKQSPDTLINYLRGNIAFHTPIVIQYDSLTLRKFRAHSAFL